MINPTIPWLIFIRICIFLLKNSIPLLLVILPLSILLFPFSQQLYFLPLFILLLIELIFYLAIYLPFTLRFRREARHPPPFSPAERRALFRKSLANVEKPEAYLSLWFLGADPAEVGRENLKEFFLWAFLDRDCTWGKDGTVDYGKGDAGVEIRDELEYYVSETERALGRPLRPGRTKVRSLRLTVDAVPTRYRSVVWYMIVCAVDIFTHVSLLWKGFQYHSLPWRKRVAVFPPRPQLWVPSGWGHRASPSEELSYWFRPHTAKQGTPVVFLHGIGIGLLPYIPFLNQLGDGSDGEGQIGIIAIENLPISMRMTAEPLSRPEFLEHISAVLAHHGWDSFTLVSHSYGSVLTTHILRCPKLAPRVEAVVLTDPVSLLLHLPDIAYNFTRRWPRRANEWQLWFFASMDPGTAHVLARHFFWRENLVWKEELLCKTVMSPMALADGDSGENGEVDGFVQRGASRDAPDVRKRKVAVSTLR